MPLSPTPSNILTLPASAMVELHSDVHLQASDAATFGAWQHYMQNTKADVVCILGDWFEVWVGDDWGLSDAFAKACAAVVRQLSERAAVYFMPGNRDFLLGSAFAEHCGLKMLPDPCVLQWQGDSPHHPSQRILLTHGDAWVTGDSAYQAFRNQVRSPQWQQDFLARPLAERIQLAAQMRAQSQAAQKAQAAQSGHSHYEDIHLPLALEQLTHYQAHTLVHGHTHRPCHEALDAQHERWVLSDWHADTSQESGRGDVLRLQAGQVQRLPIFPSH